MGELSPSDETLVSDGHVPSPLPTVGGPPRPDLKETIEAAPHAVTAPVALPAETYVIGEEIAHGGMGTVLQAEDRKLGRVVAMKVMRLETAASESHRTRFVREATVLARLEHPNIVPIHELGFDAENRLYYTMKLVQGRTLQGIINGLRRRDADFLGHYTLDRLLTIFRKICDAMSLAHAKGVIHRDLKPDNIMVGEFGEVLVMDWGLAKILGDSQQAADEEAIRTRAVSADAARRFGQLTQSALMRSSALTLDGDVMGTPLYMAPEQAEGRSASIDRQSDVFSLGGILYALLTLHPPVSGETAHEIIGKIKKGEILPPTVFNAPSKSRGGSATVGGKPADPKAFQPLPHCPGHKVPPALSAVTMRALAVDKSKRYATVADFAADIEAYQGGFATLAEHAGLLTQLRLLVQRHKQEFAVAFAAWFVIAALVVWFVINLRAKEQRAVAGEQKATASEVVARSEAVRAATAETVAVREKESARRALAKSQLDLAEKEFERGKFVEAQKILDDTPENFRDANWAFLQAHSRDDTAQLSIDPAANIFRIHVPPDADRIILRGFFRPIGVFTLSGQQVGDWYPESQNIFGTFGVDATGTRLALMASSDEVAVWDLTAGKQLRRWKTEIAMIRDVLLSPDGGTTVVAGGGQLVAYDAQTHAPIWKRPHKGVTPAFSSDGRTVAVLSARSGLSMKIELVDTRTGVTGKTIDVAADDPVKATLQFNQSGSLLACLGGEEVILWNPKTTAKIRALHFPGETVHLLSPSGNAVATVSGSRIRLWDTSTGRLLRSFNGAPTVITCVAFSPDGRMLLSGRALSSEGLVNVWPVRIGEEVVTVRAGGNDSRRIFFDRDGTTFHTSTKSGSGAATWDVTSGVQRWKLAREKLNVDGMAVSPIDGSIVISEFGKPNLTRISSTGQELPSFGENFRTAPSFSGDGQFLLTVNDQTNPIAAQFRRYNLLKYPSGKVVWTHTPQKSGKPFASLCLNDAAIATAVGDGGITVWDWAGSKPLHEIPASQTGSISCITASPDGVRLATGGPDRWIRIWDAATGRMEASFRAHWEGVRSVKFSPDGREILSGGEDGTVRIHNIATGEETLALYGNTSPVADVDFSPDGTRVASITTDGFARLWDRKRSAEAAMLPKRPAATK